MKFTKQGVVEEIILKFPNTPNMTLAKKIVKDHPKLFSNLELARTTIRNAKGLSGKVNNQRFEKSDFKLAFEKLKKDLPKGETDKKPPYVLPKANRNILVIGDIHLPYQDDEALFAALEYGEVEKVDTIIINGDLVDFYGISRHEKDPRKRSLSYELDCARVFLKGLRAMFPKALIIFSKGNHDERFEKYLMLKAPELLDIESIQLDELLKLNELSIISVASISYVMCGKLPIFHGHEVGLKSGGVNPARSIRLKLNKSAVINHFHRETKDMGRNLNESPYSCYSNGCLCDLYPAYMGVHSNWNHGLIHIKLDQKGNYFVHQKTIIDGKIY
jgi:predicted phosphodiesterase